VEEIVYKPIGIIHTDYHSKDGTPIQPGVAGRESKGFVELFEEYQEGLDSLEQFSHVILLYHFHRSSGYDLRIVPFLDDEKRGVFATRAPRRPNPIGLSVVYLERIVGNILHIAEVDILDGTPLLDLKPYVPRFDHRSEVRVGWLTRRLREKKRFTADGRFARADEEEQGPPGADEL
jgi:tRNA-Thr(GGU) m(6)t(6)A37 methyltransferase TsaA